MGHFARGCKQDINPTRAIGKLHHTLKAETPVAKSLLTEFFNKLMRVQRKHDRVQAKLKKARQTGVGRSARGKPTSRECPPGAAKPPGVTAPPKGGRRVQPKRAVRFQNQKEKDKAGGTPRKGDNCPATPPANQKEAVSEVLDEEDTQDTDYDTDDLADLPTDSDTEGAIDDPLGLDPDPKGDPQ